VWDTATGHLKHCIRGHDGLDGCLCEVSDCSSVFKHNPDCPVVSFHRSIPNYYRGAIKKEFLEIARLVSVEVGVLNIIQLCNRQQKNRCVVACLHLRKLGAAGRGTGPLFSPGSRCSQYQAHHVCLDGAAVKAKRIIRICSPDWTPCSSDLCIILAGRFTTCIR
jgi:hypothetical protein